MLRGVCGRLIETVMGGLVRSRVDILPGLWLRETGRKRRLFRGVCGRLIGFLSQDSALSVRVLVGRHGVRRCLLLRGRVSLENWIR